MLIWAVSRAGATFGMFGWTGNTGGHGCIVPPPRASAAGRIRPELGLQTMYACRAALLLAALTCSAHAAEVISFSADHITIKVGTLGGNTDTGASEIARRFCRTYGKYPREIARENLHQLYRINPPMYTKNPVGQQIHYACIKE